ncbi:hypothetical protein GE21DRAFT_1008402 [Neurospora crassa]|nr:hypothetical protein GE21DRAFT_1008402 [Neurospora crassa]
MQSWPTQPRASSGGGRERRRPKEHDSQSYCCRRLMHISLMSLFFSSSCTTEGGICFGIMYMWCTRYTTGLLCREGEQVGSVVLHGGYLYQSAYRHGVIPEAWKLARGKIDYRPAQKIFYYDILNHI